MAEWPGDLEEAKRIVDDVRYNARSPEGVVSEADWSRLGSASDYMGGVLQLDLVEESPPVIEPPDPPVIVTPGRDTSDPILTLRGFAAQMHWPGSPEGYYAIDWYPDASESGKSDDMPISWPVGGTVRRAGQKGPMLSRMGHDAPIQEDWKTLPADKMALWGAESKKAGAKFGNETLWTAILDGDNGVSYGFTHVRQDMMEGRAEAEEIFGWVDSSGIGMFKAAGLQPGHIHLACYRGAPGNWNGAQGNIPAFQEVMRLGFQIRTVQQIPSPNDYMMYRARAGKFL